MAAEIFPLASRDNNLPSNVSSMYEGSISIETNSAGAGTDVASMMDNEHLSALLRYTIYNLGKCRLTDKFLNFKKFRFFDF